MRWVSITALLLAVARRPSANYQILLHLVVCVGATMVVLALVFIKQKRSVQGVDLPSGKVLQGRQ